MKAEPFVQFGFGWATVLGEIYRALQVATRINRVTCADCGAEPERPAAADPIAQSLGALEAPIPLRRRRQHFAGTEREQRGGDLVSFRGLAHAITSYGRCFRSEE